VPHVRRVLVAALACLLLAGGLGVGVSAPASAGITTLCRGYDGCRRLGMPNAGYQTHSATMYWRMFPGHNCTNYAAYRMVRSGLPNVRPWDGPGNAEYWGLYKPGITDATPRVGSVAWWKANVPGAGSSGHVAYVQQVVSADEIIVSQDSWGGTFSWARITRGTGWPSGFIHFNDVRLTALTPPTVSGTPRQGEVLTASPGTWKPGTGATYAYQWRADGLAIEGATAPTFTVGAAQQGRQISVRVTASRLGYLRGTAVSADTAPVESTQLASIAPPRISGDPAVDQTLAASSGRWTAEPTAVAYQWSADGVPIEGAIDATLTPGPDLVDKALSVTVTASREGYADASATSLATAPVAKGTIVRTGAPVVSGRPRLGETLQVDPGSFTPADATVSVRWLRAGVPVEGATGSTYRLTRADLGERVAARVRLTRPGYEALRARSAETAVVKSPPTLVVETQAGTGTLRASVSVTAPGIRSVPGTVRIRSETRRLAELTLRQGAAATTLRGLRRGLRTFTFRYPATDKVARTALSRTVRIR
jgi:surface antigen